MVSLLRQILFLCLWNSIYMYSIHILYKNQWIFLLTTELIFQVDNLKYEHDKLQKKSNKQAAQVEKERDQVILIFYSFILNDTT